METKRHALAVVLLDCAPACESSLPRLLRASSLSPLARPDPDSCADSRSACIPVACVLMGKLLFSASLSLELPAGAD